jgi:predicted alpha/beta-hydrolase family hydrolase
VHAFPVQHRRKALLVVQHVADAEVAVHDAGRAAGSLQLRDLAVEPAERPLDRRMRVEQVSTIHIFDSAPVIRERVITRRRPAHARGPIDIRRKDAMDDAQVLRKLLEESRPRSGKSFGGHQLSRVAVARNARHHEVVFSAFPRDRNGCDNGFSPSLAPELSHDDIL